MQTNEVINLSKDNQVKKELQKEGVLEIVGGPGYIVQLTNKIFVIFNSKSDNKLGYFKTELIEAISPKYFNK